MKNMRAILGRREYIVIDVKTKEVFNVIPDPMDASDALFTFLGKTRKRYINILLDYVRAK